uniref:GTD-binding domain-containing protein n=1 Tax=Zea mays TaxID=4577 RepID=A0A804R6F7_MAIZE
MSASASAGKLAAALHRRTRRVTSALACAALEWVLIALLLVNGLLAYAVARFADYFGLSPPCLLCSRVDRLFQAEGGGGGDASGAGARWLRDALCDAHAAEISALGYCLRHRRLAEAGEMCVGCRPSSWKERTSDAGACACCEAAAVLRASPVRELEDTTRDARVSEKEVEDGDQGYVLLAQDDHEEEPDEVENRQQEPQSEVDGRQHLEDEVMAAVQDESLEFMDQVEDITIEDDRLVSVVALDEMTIADDSGLHRDVEEVDGTNHVVEDEQDPRDVDTNCEVSIGSDICEREQDEHVVPFQDLAAFEELVAPLATGDDLPLPSEVLEPPDQEAGEVEQEDVTTSTGLDLQPNEQNEIEEDRAPETPTNSVATQRSDRMFLLERKRSLSLSLDGSVASEMEGSEPSTVDQLKSALQAERKALGALYAELEEERNAAAIATNQTMAMINRLQEEKAAMQMEALQYQRMMEEQSEYDQEALQLLNELVSKRAREKQELERELELYRQKVQHYEDKERRRTASFKANGVSPSGSGTSVSSSGEDSDGHSDDYCELGDSPDGGNVQSSSDAALSSMRDQDDGTKHLAALDDSLTYFEVERLSILEELKTLEERLFTLEDDDINTSKEVTGHSSSDMDLPHDGLQSPEYILTGDRPRFGGRASISRGKSLLPLFDAVGDEACDRMPPSAGAGEADQADDAATKPASVLVKEQERLAIIEEVDHVYERLQALEADKEFLRHCIKSLKKGDKGMDLLQEILQHLRDLRSVELHVKNAGGAMAANSA